jgi:hypothetical protein
MYGEFVFRNKEYEIKMSEMYDEHLDKKRPFQSAKEVSLLFDRIAREDIIAFQTIIETAELSYHHLCYAPRRCSPQPNIQQALDELSLKIFEGEMILVERRQFYRFMGSVFDIRPEACCIKVIEEINGIISRGKWISVILVALPILKAFFSHPQQSTLSSLVSTAHNIHSEEWELLAETIKVIPETTRKLVADVANMHAMYHGSSSNSDRNLTLFWEGVAHAFVK